jgi:ribosomal protein L14
LLYYTGHSFINEFLSHQTKFHYYNSIIIIDIIYFSSFDEIDIYYLDNAGVIINAKGEMKGSAITGPVGKECADLFPRVASAAGTIF